MSTAGKEVLDGVTALVFDVFGTSVQWRTPVTQAINKSWAAKGASDAIPSEVRARLSKLTVEDAGRFTQEWRSSYWAFCQGFKPGDTEWKDVDAHHHDSLVELLSKWELSNAYTADQVKELSLVWHHLDPWEDSIEGLRRLGTKFKTACLSNGNQALLEDLNKQLEGSFEPVISSADFKAYKPNPAVYNEALGKLGRKPEEAAMVAAHLGDLKAAKGRGMRTVFVERPGEEDPRDVNEEAREWVDMWISMGEGGFVELAKRLGC